MQRYFSFNTYLKKIFKERVHRISINAGFCCPNLDGTISHKGCIFCNNLSFVKEYDFNTNQIENIKNQIEQSIEFFTTQKIKKFIAYFQAYSNTYSDPETLKKIYDIIKNYPQIVGLSISTRPDCIDEEKLKLINTYTDNYLVWIEYGMQTSDDAILNWLNRGHSFFDFIKAVELTKKHPKINIGAHIMLGLPQQDIIKDAKAITELKINGVKLHVLHVLKGTYLERLYKEGNVRIITQTEYVEQVCSFLENIPPDVVIFRLVSTAKNDFLITPSWMNNKADIILEIEKELEKRNSYQGKNLI